jgi:hypothetical protein
VVGIILGSVRNRKMAGQLKSDATFRTDVSDFHPWRLNSEQAYNHSGQSHLPVFYALKQTWRLSTQKNTVFPVVVCWCEYFESSVLTGIRGRKRKEMTRNRRKMQGLCNLTSSLIMAMKLWSLKWADFIWQVEQIRHTNRTLVEKCFEKRNWKP